MSLSTQPFEPTHVLRTAVSLQPHPNTIEAPLTSLCWGRPAGHRQTLGWGDSLADQSHDAMCRAQLQQHSVSHGAGSTDLCSRQEEQSIDWQRDQARHQERVWAGLGLEASPPVTGEPHHSPHLRTDQGWPGGVAARCHWLIKSKSLLQDQPEATDRYRFSLTNSVLSGVGVRSGHHGGQASRGSPCLPWTAPLSWPCPAEALTPTKGTFWSVQS